MLSASGWLFKKKSITMHDHMNVKFTIITFMQTFYSGTRDIFYTKPLYSFKVHFTLKIVTGITSL